MTSSTCSRRLRWFRRAVYASACALTTTSERAASQPVQERIVASQLQQVANLLGELEVAVSPDGRQRIIAVNGPRVPGFGAAVVFFWNEATASFRPGNPPLRMANQRDPTVAWAGSGDFYFATMETARNVAVSRSTDGGRNFTAQSLNGDGRADPATGAGVCPVAGCTTDQPHIAADPRPHAAGADEIYLVWRNFAAGETAMIECSTDSGVNWQNRQAISGAGGGQFPRVTVGPDGSVFALTVTNRNGGSILLQKFSPCSAGLAPAFTDGAGASVPRVAVNFAGVSCPVPGLDRCNSGNVLTSHMVAVDRADANRVYVTFATQNGTLNEDIMVVASTDGGQSFPPALQIAANESGGAVRRFLPWSCATRNHLFVTWYDRRAATLVQNDATEFFVNRVSLRDGRLLRLDERSISGTPDPHCAAGWPAPARNIGDSESCSIQPQNAGQCLAPTATACTAAAPCPGGQSCLAGFCFVNDPAPPRCDFSGGCAAGLSCTVGAGGPKFGDYNGIACSDGSAFVAWAAATAPTGLPAVGALNIFFARVDVLPLADSLCSRSPELCNFRPRLDNDKITIRCDRPGCRVIVPVPDICTKVVNCPGCGPEQLCTPDYSLSLTGLRDAWQVELVEPNGRGAPATISRRAGQTIVRFKPPKDDQLGVRGAKYFLVFRLARNGRVGADYPVTLKMSARLQ